MRYLWLLAALTSLVTGLIVIEKVIFHMNPLYGKGVTSIGTLPNGTTTFNVDHNLTKSLNGKVLLMTKAFWMNGKTKIPVIRIPTINYCDMIRGHLIPMQLMQQFIDRIKQFGRLIVPCPVLPGNYYLKNIFFDETQFPMYHLLQENIKIILDVAMTQEIANKQAPVFDIKFHFTCNRSNWP